MKNPDHTTRNRPKVRRPVKKSEMEIDMPAWLPAGAIAYADFVNGHYWMGGAEVSVESMFASNQDYAGFNFTASDIVSGEGLVSNAGHSNGGAFQGAALADMIGGATIVMDFAVSSKVTPAPYITIEYVESATYSTDYVAIFGRIAGEIGDANGSGVQGTPYVVGGNKAAVTFLPGVRAALALNGELIASLENPVVGNPVDLIYFMINAGTKLKVRSITVYGAVANTDLVALSA